MTDQPHINTNFLTSLPAPPSPSALLDAQLVRLCQPTFPPDPPPKTQHSSFFYALWAAGAALAAALLGTGARPPSWGSALALAACFAVPVAIMLPSSVTFMAHIMEKVRGRGIFCLWRR